MERDTERTAMSDGRWIVIGLIVMSAAVGWVMAGGGEKGATTIVMIAMTIMFRAITRPVSAPFIPEGGWLFWTGTAFVAAGMMAALWLQSFFWLSILMGIGAVLVISPTLLKAR